MPHFKISYNCRLSSTNSFLFYTYNMLHIKSSYIRGFSSSDSFRFYSFDILHIKTSYTVFWVSAQLHLLIFQFRLVWNWNGFATYRNLLFLAFQLK